MLSRTTRTFLAAMVVTCLLAAGVGLLLPPAGAAPAGSLAAAREAMVDRAVHEAAPALAAWIIETRDTLADGALPPPPKIQALLRDYFPPQLIGRVRYRIGWPPGAWGTAFRLSNARAVTIDRVIVFRDREIAADPVIWAHELAHARQYQTWGVPEFARRYLRDRAGVEAEAWNVAATYKMWALVAGRL